MTGSGLLAVHAHPDDETLSTGALLATWAASGAPVTVVTCTRGERGEVIPPDLAHLARDPAGLAAHRERELVAALEALGVTDHAYLDALPGPDGARRAAPYVDSGMAWVTPGRAGPAPDAGPDAFSAAPVEEAAVRLAVLLRARRPAVVVGYEPGGGYGHPDHVRAHRVLTRGVELAGDGRALPGTPHEVRAVLWAAVDADAWRVARAELPEPPAGLRGPGPGRAVPSSAVPSSEVDVRVDVAPVLGRVAAALRAHATQVQGVRTWEPTGGVTLGCLALSDGVLQPLLRHECYRVASGGLAGPALPTGVAG